MNSHFDSSALRETDANQTWATSMSEIMREVIRTLPDHTTLGELIEVTNRNQTMAPVLSFFTVQSLIDAVKTKQQLEKPKPTRKSAQTGKNGAGDSEAGGPLVIRRRADAPDADVRVLKWLTTHSPQKDNEIANGAELSSEQLRLVLRQLRAKGYIHIEGTGAKRRIKITRHGSSYLRKLGFAAIPQTA